MKLLLKTLALLMLVFGVGFGVYRIVAADKPVTLSEIDKEKLVRTDLQLKLLNQRYQGEAQPVVEEQMVVMKRVCALVKATPGVDCEVNVQTGAVKKTSGTPLVPPVSPKK